MGLITIVAFAVALAAAARSTWSPCGLSMLSTITPLSERGRGHRYGGTAAWFIAGAVLGGVTLGMGAALLAVGWSATGPSTAVAEGLAAGAALLGAAGDAGLAGIRFPLFRRQVNERWLDQYRAWFYGAGFGWQVGVGLATYIMTAGVFVTIVAATLTGHPWTALGVCVTFGSARGLTVLLTRRLHSTQALRSFHRHFSWLEAPVRIGTIAVQIAGGALLAGAVWAPAGAAVVMGSLGVVAVSHQRRQATIWSRYQSRKASTEFSITGDSGPGR
ncbi:MAG: hypothetical protein M3063_15715 [Actinomycetota bacterium]|nr:hypothetical protein [Actinomycetota bacterium]